MDSDSNKPNRDGLTNRGKLLLGNISSLFVLQAANYIFPLITLPYLVRVLGPDKFGLTVFAQTFVQYFVIFTDYGFNYTATRQLSIARDNNQKCSEIFSSVIAIKLALTIVSFGIMTAIVFAFLEFRMEWPLYLAAFLLVPGAALFPLWLYQGLERMKYITVINVSARALSTIAIFLFVKSQDDYVLSVLFVSLGWLLIGIVGLLGAFVVLKVRPVLPSFKLIKESLKEGWSLFISTAAISLYTTSTIFILGLMTNNIIVGYFGAADKIVRAFRGLLVPVTQALYPHISAMAAKSKEEALEFIIKCQKWMGFGSLVLSVFIFIFADLMVQIALGPEYKATILLVRIMAFLPFIIALSNVSGILTMLTFGYNKSFSRVLIAAGLTNICLIIPLIHFYDAVGAAVAMVLTEIFVALSMFMSLRRKGVDLINRDNSV